MRVLLSCASLAAGAALIWSAAADATQPSGHPCRPAGSTVLERSALILVVRREGGVIQACHRQRPGGVTTLDRRPDGPYDRGAKATVLTVNGPLLAYQWAEREQSARGGFTDMRVRVLDVRTGGLVVDAAAFTGSKWWLDFHDSEVSDLVLRADGLVAWTAPVPPREYEPPSPPIAEVRWAHPKLHRARVAAAVPGADVGPLTVGPKWMYWRESGALRAVPVHEEKAAPLPERPRGAASWCRPRGSELLMRTTEVLVVRRANARLQACDRQTGRRVMLSRGPTGSEFDSDVWADPLTVAGTLVAVQLNVYVPRGDFHMRVAVRDVRSGRRLVRCDGYSAEYFWQVSGSQILVDTVALRPDGTLAWTARPPVPVGVPERGGRELWWGAPGGGCTRVAASDAIRARTLALGARDVFWLQADRPLSAPLDG